MEDAIKIEIVQQIKDGYANFGNNDFNAMTIMNSYITDNPGNVHLKVEDIQAIYNEVKSAKQMLVSDMELKLKGKHIITPAEYDVDTNELISAVVYYTPTTQVKFLEDFDVYQHWGVEEVFNELKGEMTWEELKAHYTQQE